MKKIIIIFIIIFVAIDILFIVLGYFSKSGEPAGLVDGILAKCPAKPNCVCSEKNNDAGHFIEPILVGQSNPDDAMNIMKDIINELGGVIQTETGNYLAATFSSALFGFVDDLELRIDSVQNLIHIRSASRVGYGDFGVNKTRAESIKALYNEKTNKTEKIVPPLE